MANITRTIYSVALQSALRTRFPYVIQPNTTLNEKFEILKDAQPSEGQWPATQYLVIGNGGHRHETGPDGTALTGIRTHRASDAACFNHMPLAMRTLDNDFTGEERKQYALRRVEEWDGIQYAVYYAKRIPDVQELITAYNKVTITDGNTSTVEYEFSGSNLNPIPVEVNPNDITETSGEYVVASTLLSLIFTEYEIQEIVNAMIIRHGDPLYAIISEVALVSGIDRLTQAENADGVQFDYMEVIAAQIDTFICTHHPVHQLNNGLNLEFELGGSESLTIPDTSLQLIG